MIPQYIFFLSNEAIEELAEAPKTTRDLRRRWTLAKCKKLILFWVETGCPSGCALTLPIQPELFLRSGLEILSLAEIENVELLHVYQDTMYIGSSRFIVVKTTDDHEFVMLVKKEEEVEEYGRLAAEMKVREEPNLSLSRDEKEAYRTAWDKALEELMKYYDRR